MIRRSLALVVLVAVVASTASSQQAAACPIDMLQPTQLGLANLQKAQLVQAKTEADAQKALKQATKVLFDPKIVTNTIGRDYLLAQFLSLAVEHGGDVQTRGALGFPGDQAASVDLLVAIDSLLTIVEKGNPACAAEAKDWREYKPFAAQVQAGYKAIGANDAATAEKAAKRAMVLSKSSAQVYDILWRVAKAKGDNDGMISNLRLAADALKSDTANAPVRANLLFNLGRVQQDIAEKAAEPKKGEMYRAAAKVFLEVANEYPQSEEAPFAVQGIRISAGITSDKSITADLVKMALANATKLTDGALAQAGVAATGAGNSAEAAKLFEAAATQNPYSRDYLYNWAAMLYDTKRSAEMIPVVRKLVALDPSNPENVMLFAYAYKGLSDVPGEKLTALQKDSASRYLKADLATKKTIRDSIAVYRSAQKVLIDSVVAYSKLGDEMPHKVTYTGLDRLKDKTTVAGEIENRGKAARSFTVEFEFLGKDGAVVGKQTATVANVAPGASGKFTVELAVGGVQGVRYAAIPLK
jgi:tetratricopeptide (TPR) repeat protein